eukprot:2805889-Prymnesium_polylepis.1
MVVVVGHSTPACRVGLWRVCVPMEVHVACSELQLVISRLTWTLGSSTRFDPLHPHERPRGV